MKQQESSQQRRPFRLKLSDGIRAGMAERVGVVDPFHLAYRGRYHEEPDAWMGDYTARLLDAYPVLAQRVVTNGKLERLFKQQFGLMFTRDELKYQTVWTAIARAMKFSSFAVATLIHTLEEAKI